MIASSVRARARCVWCHACCGCGSVLWYARDRGARVSVGPAKRMQPRAGVERIPRRPSPPRRYLRRPPRTACDGDATRNSRQARSRDAVRPPRRRPPRRGRWRWRRRLAALVALEQDERYLQVGHLAHTAHSRYAKRRKNKCSQSPLFLSSLSLPNRAVPAATPPLSLCACCHALLRLLNGTLTSFCFSFSYSCFFCSW